MANTVDNERFWIRSSSNAIRGEVGSFSDVIKLINRIPNKVFEDDSGMATLEAVNCTFKYTLTREVNEYEIQSSWVNYKENLYQKIEETEVSKWLKSLSEGEKEETLSEDMDA